MKRNILPQFLLVGAIVSIVAPALMNPAAVFATTELHSIRPADVLSKLYIDYTGLDAMKEAINHGEHNTALGTLLTHYREKHPLEEMPNAVSETNLAVANNVVNHIFQWGPYEKAPYGEDIRWDWDPRGDIEWVAAMYRFHWAESLVQAFSETEDQKYGEAFVELTRDWITKHPLQERDKTHYVYEYWKGFAWLDIQTGIRATRLCQAFPVMVHADAFTPEFLEIFMASLYDHQAKTEMFPMGKVHNKAVFEQRGFVNIAYNFPEFHDSRRWMTLAMERLHEVFMAQVTPDGVQREWSGGYHSGVLRDAVEIMGRMNAFDIPVPADYRNRVHAMYDYIFGMATPELAYPMFGDTSRDITLPSRRSRYVLYSELVEATELFGDPKYAARATLDQKKLPKQRCYAFRDAGMYAMRNEWGPDQIYMALHCSPPAISSHDQPDNGTFELYAFGHWLMADSGYYTYGHDKKARAWHRQTSVHQTLTLDGKNTAVAAKPLLWHTEPDLTVVTVENASYPDLTHRRTLWFVDNTFFVLLDEAIGNAKGILDLHFQFAAGEVVIDSDNRQAATKFDDANILVWQNSVAPVALEKEDGWFAWSYGKRKARTAIRFRHKNSAPVYFLTVIVPYRGVKRPFPRAELPQEFDIGSDRIVISVNAFDKTYEIGRNLKNKNGWCNIVNR
ncbi:MAG: alginate lyase family protein [Candidatus Hydrogenedentes bacterium]|nr:alginate lyase family protein [Candidatus Hydrogenedentota bacterium]